MNITKTHLKRVVIIGAGFAGLQLAKKINKKYFQVVLLDKNNYHAFQPLLYQVATAALDSSSVAQAVRSIFSKRTHNNNFYFRIANIHTIDAQNKIIHSNVGDLNYNYLVIATGSITNFYGNLNVAKHAMPMKTVPEAIELRSLMLQNFERALLTDDLNERKSLMNFVIVGGGPTGVELAGALAELKSHVLPNDYPDLDIKLMEIHLLDATKRLLTGMSDVSSQTATNYLKKLGVQVWFDTMVSDYDGKVVVTNQSPFETRNLIWAAGVKGFIVSGLGLNATERDRYLVNGYNQVNGYDNIFAIGDVACLKDQDYPNGHPMVAQVAIQQGYRLAKNLDHWQQKQNPQIFKYNDKGSMATIGRNKAVADIAGFHLNGFFAWLVWMVIHLVSLVGFRNKTVALINWIIGYFSYDKKVRLIIFPFKKHNRKETEHVVESVSEWRNML